MTERAKRPSHEDGKTPERVKAFAAKWGWGEKEAWDYLAQYGLNRLAALADDAAKKGKSERAPKKGKAKRSTATKARNMSRAGIAVKDAKTGKTFKDGKEVKS